MAVKIGHARISEKGTVTGVAGDSTGKEVTITDYYVHPKKWVVLRCKDEKKRVKIAEAMEKACKNNDIGYDQNQRDTLFNNVKDKGFDPSKTTKKVETACSALVRVCIAYAYGKDIAGNIRTVTLPDMLNKTGEFELLTASKYCTTDKNLKKGDILCTATKGHVVVALENGANISSEYPTSNLNKTIKWTGVVTASSLNVRTGAGKEYSKCSFSPYKKNKEVNICDSVKASDGSTWYYIEHNDKYGFLHSNYVKKKVEKKEVKYKTTANLNMRKVAGATKDNKNIICVIPKGKNVVYKDKYKVVNNVKWRYVTYDGKTGYCSGKYLKKVD